MAFWKSDDEEKKEEMEEVKRQVEGSKTKLPEPPKPPAPQNTEQQTETVPQPPSPQETETQTEPEPEFEEEAPSMQEQSIETTRQPRAPAGEDFAPLFVKIDKYRQVLENLEGIKNELQNIKDLFTLMNEVDQIKREGMKNLRQGIAGLAGALINMDQKFIRPEGTEEIKGGSKSEVSETVEELQGQLRTIRSELDSLE